MLVTLSLSLAALALASSPGTETILLVKGGYGPGVNLFSSSSKTQRTHASAPKVELRTEKEQEAVKEVNDANNEVFSLRQQLQEVTKGGFKVMQQAQEQRIDLANLQEEERQTSMKLQRVQSSAQQEAQLQQQVQALKSQIAAEQQKAAAERKRGQAFQTKVQTLEHDIHILSKAWRAAAKHQANLAKEAAEEADAP